MQGTHTVAAPSSRAQYVVIQTHDENHYLTVALVPKQVLLRHNDVVSVGLDEDKVISAPCASF